MGWPVDDLKLDRVRQAMEEQDLDVLLVRTPDNVLYLSNYWSMKGWEIALFPRTGDPVLVAVEPQRSELEATAWTTDVAWFSGFDVDDARPPMVRALEAALDVVRDRGWGRSIGVELSATVQAPERMIGESTIFWEGFYQTVRKAAGEVVDCTPMLTGLRMIKTPQEIERIRITNDLAAEAVEHVRNEIRPGMRDADVAALYEGFVHANGIGYRGQVQMARAFTLVWSGDAIQTFTQTKPHPVGEDVPTLMEIWTCTDGYWNDLTKNACPGTLTPEYGRLLDLLLAVFDEALADYIHDGAALAELDAMIRTRIAEGGYPGQPSHYVCHGVGARAHEPPWAHPLSADTMRTGMVLAVEPGVYWDGGGGLRLEDNVLVTADGADKLCTAPEDFRR